MLHDRISADTTCLLVVDVQEKFSAAIPTFETVAINASILVRGCAELGVPVIVTEQYPRGLGHTVPVVRSALRENAPLEKRCFASTDDSACMTRLADIAPRTVLLCGVEAHVCVQQSALGLLERGYAVHVVVDAVGSRKSTDRETALRKMELCGVMPTTVEMSLFEMMRDAGSPSFKPIQQLIK